jgi:hypothetical protein
MRQTVLLAAASALILMATSPSLPAEDPNANGLLHSEIPHGKAFLRCGGWNCDLTATEIRSINTTQAWALGRTTERDAKNDCQAREGPDFKACVADQMSRPPLVITANCVEGTVGIAGANEEYKISEKAKKGQFADAEGQAFWDGDLTHRGRITVITWFRLLCPNASAKWHVRAQ